MLQSLLAQLGGADGGFRAAIYYLHVLILVVGLNTHALHLNTTLLSLLAMWEASSAAVHNLACWGCESQSAAMRGHLAQLAGAV